MANPQKENGYTAIANETMEALAKIRIAGEANQVLVFILRKTYGFNKKEDAIALTQMMLGTRLKKPDCCRAIRKLLSMNLISIGKKATLKGKTYIFNKDFDTWKPLAKKPPIGKNANKSLAKMHTTIVDNTKVDIPKGIANKSAEPLEKEINSIIPLFEPVNPTYKTFFSNKTQRAALVWLLKEFGREKLESMIKALPRIINRKYAPKVTTPLELQRDLGKLKAFAEQERSSSANKLKVINI